MERTEKKTPVSSGSLCTFNDHQNNYTKFLNLIKEVFPEGGFIEFRTFAPEKNTVRDFFRTEDCEGIETYLAEHPVNTFFGVAARKNKGGKKEDVGYCRVVWIDKDIDKDGDISTEEFIAKLNGFLFPPSYIANSGHGIHAYWLLKEPVETPEELTRLEELNKSFARYFSTDFNVCDYSRIMRVPGTINRKPGMVTVECDLLKADSLVQYNFEDLCEEFPVKTEETDPASNHAGPSSIKPKSFSEKIVDRVIEECAFLRHTRDDAEKLTEPEWFRMINNLVALNAIEKIHELSRPYPGYSRQETERKIEHSLKDSPGPNSCEDIGNYFSGCKDCPWHGKVKAPAGIAWRLKTPRKGRTTIFRDEEGKPSKTAQVVAGIVSSDLFPSLYYEKSTDRFFEWNELFFDERSDLDVKRLIQLEADKEDFVVLDNTLNNIVATLKTLPYLKDVPEMKRDHIPLKNGSLAVSATNPPKLEQHSPENGNKYVLPFDYDPNAKCPVFDAFLKSLDLGKENEDLIQEIFGYFFLPMNALNLQKCVFFYGPGANGKSTMANLLFYMLGGIKNCSTLRVDQLNGFELARVLDKPANIGSEVTSGKNYIDTQVLKSIVSGDALTINRKYKDPIDYVPQCKFLFTVNSLPNVSDSSHGFARRLLIIEFNKIIPVEFQDEQLLDKLMKEASGVFNWLLEGIERLLTHNGFTNTAQSDLVVVKNYSESNPVYLWAESHIYYEEGNFERTDWLYQSYRKWAIDSGFNALNITNFAKELKKVLAESFGWEISLGRESSKGRKRGFTNIGMIFAPDLFSDMSESLLQKENKPSRISRRSSILRT